jgi:hypothetical protein
MAIISEAFYFGTVFVFSIEERLTLKNKAS